MRKIKLLIAALAIVGGVNSVSAQVYIETDLTSQFSSLTDWEKWTGATGYTATNFCPEVEINGIGSKQVCEKYETTCASTGDIFYQTVTGLTTGTYKIELYGGAAFTYGRGFGSMAFTGEIGTGDAWGTHNSETYTAGQHIDENTGVYLYATTSEGTKELEIPIYYATNFPDGAATVVLNEVEVGSDGEVKLGLKKTSQSTNWHVIQLKSVIATVDATEALANLKSQAKALLEDDKYKNVSGSERTNLQAAYEATPAEETAEAYQTVISALNTAIPVFESVNYASYDAFAAEKAYAEKLGATVSIAPENAAAALEAVNPIKVIEYNYVTENFPKDFSSTYLATPTTNTFDALDAQHWSGEKRSYFDFWNGSSADRALTYKIKLPEGKYIIKAAGRGQSNTESKVTISDGTEVVEFVMKGDTGLGINKEGATSFDADDAAGFANENKGRGWEWRYLLIDLAQETELTLSLNGHVNNSWIGACDFALLTTADNSAINRAAYLESLAAAEAALNNNDYVNVTGVERQDLIDAINTDVTAGTTEVYDDAKAVIDAATEAFIAAKAAYDAYLAFNAENAAIFGEAVSVDFAVGSAQDAVAATQALKLAQYDYVTVNYPNSMTSKIGEFSSWTMAATSGGKNDTPQTMNKEHWSAATHTYYEQGEKGWAASAFTVSYTKEATLPAGDYVIKVAARASAGVDGTITATATNNSVALTNVGAASKGIDTNGDANFGEGTFANNNIGYGWEWRFLPFTMTQDGSVTITISAANNSNTIHQWVSIADAELLSAQDLATPLNYNDAEQCIVEDVEVANVSISRTVKEGFNTVVLPFDLTQAQVTKAFGAGTTVYAFSENSEDAASATVNFNSVSAGTISANVPVLIKATAASTEQTFEGVQVVAPANGAIVTGTNFDFVGTYAPIEAIAAGDYFVGNGALYKSEGATSMKAFRAYIHNKTNASVRFVIDGVEATGIDAVEVISNNNGKLYNLAGQEVKSAKKGIYIQNGKKYVVK